MSAGVCLALVLSLTFVLNELSFVLVCGNAYSIGRVTAAKLELVV